MSKITNVLLAIFVSTAIAEEIKPNKFSLLKRVLKGKQRSLGGDVTNNKDNNTKEKESELGDTKKTIEIYAKQGECNVPLMSNFVPDSDFNTRPIEGSQAVKEYCPSMKQSCCDEETIKTLISQVKYSIYAVSTEIQFSSLLIKKLEEFDISSWERFFKLYPAAHKNCVGNEKGRFLNLVDELISNKKFYFEQIKKVYKNILRNEVSFKCSLCSVENHEFIGYSGSNGKEGYYFIQHNQLNYLETYYQLLQNQFEIKNFYLLSSWLSCFNGQINEGQLKIELNIFNILDDQKIKLDIASIKNNAETLKQIKMRYFPGIVSLPFFTGMMKTVEEISRIAFSKENENTTPLSKSPTDQIYSYLTIKSTDKKKFTKDFMKATFIDNKAGFIWKINQKSYKGLAYVDKIIDQVQGIGLMDIWIFIIGVLITIY